MRQKTVMRNAVGRILAMFAILWALWALWAAAGCGGGGKGVDIISGKGVVEGIVYAPAYDVAPRVAGVPTGYVAVANAAVSIVGVATATAVTDASGYFRIADVPQGDQTVRIVRAGYAAIEIPIAVQSGVTINLNNATSDNALTLAPGGAGVATGSILVTVRAGNGIVPIEAAVYINNKPTGKTTSPSAVFTDVRVGSYEVAVVAAGYAKPATQTVSVTEGAVTPVTFSAAPSDGNNPPIATILTPTANQQFTAGNNVTFTGAGVDNEDGTLTANSLTWSSSVDGFLGNGTFFQKNTLTAATHTIYLVVRDSGGKTATDSVVIGVKPAGANTAPIAAIVAPASGTTYAQGATATFIGAGADGEDGALIGDSLVWRSSRDGELGTGANLQTTQLSVGTHTITLVATDSKGLTSTAVISVIVTSGSAVNTPPTAIIIAPQDNAVVTSGAATALYGLATDAQDTAIVGTSLAWKSNRDGALGTGAALLTTKLRTKGIHTITLTATDSGGLKGSATVHVTVQ